MKTKLISLLLGSLCPALFVANAAVPGPTSNFDKNSLWTRPDMNGTDAVGLATRGLLFVDMTNEVGAVDRLSEALGTATRTFGLSESEISEIRQFLAVAGVLSGTPGAVEAVDTWLADNMASPHRTDMTLLKADLLLERGDTGQAAEVYETIDIEALTPNLRADFLYHNAFTQLLLANYADARNLFSDPELLASADYGNAARFYSGYIEYVDRNYKEALNLWESVNPYTMPGDMADYYRAQIAYLDGNYSEALRLARPLASKSVNEPLFVAEANRIVGESLYQQGDASQAVSYLKKYVSEVDTPERSALYILGIANYEDGDYRAAVDNLTPVTSDASAMGQSAYLYIGQALLKLNDDNGAIMAFNRALSMNYDKAVTESAYYNYAVAKSRGANVPFASSVTIFEDFMSKFPDSRFANDVTGYMVNGYLTDGNYEAALKSLSKVKRPTPALNAAKQKVLYLLGGKYLAADRPDDAVKMLTQAKELATYDKEIGVETDLLLGEAYYRAGNYTEAASSLLSYLGQTDSSTPNRAVALYDLGYTRLSQKEWAKAQLDFERLLAAPGNLTSSTLADAQSRLGDARYYQRNWSGAAEAYNGAYTLDPASGDYPLFQKAVMQGYAGDYDGKLATLTKLKNQFPTSAILPDALMEEAEAYVQLKRTDLADNVYRKLISDYAGTNQSRKAYLFLASDLAGSGDTDGAISTYHELIKKYSTSEEARLADEAVKRLHAEQGSLADYARFIATTENAPTFDSEEAETLSWNAAEHAWLSGKGTALLEKYVADYPKGAYTVRAVAYLFDDACESGDENDMYRWSSILAESYPDAAATEDALVVKAEIEYDRGRKMDAMQTWTILESKASTPENKNTARLGIMRVARETGDTEKMRSSAEALMQSSTVGSEEKTEASFTRALALNLDGEVEGALAAWTDLAANPDDIYGAKSAVYAAEALNGSGRYKEASELAEKFINSGTPHTYWLARGFIALSDAYSGLDRKFEAREYLKALKENYPGSETDIFDMIEERLK